MKLYTTSLLFLFCITVAFSQGEANNWYFGNNAGIQFFEDGSVLPLNGSQMTTSEGCSTISDADGNLLFYTDGRNVWDTNHVIMPNGNYNFGTGLNGDPSSTQSGIIVPKKGDPNIYYIFTVDEPHHQNAEVYPAQFTGIYNDTGQGVPEADDGFNNGLNYSVVDLSLLGANGSIGDITTRNVQLVTYDPLSTNEAKYKCSEKITAVKNADNTGFWVVTHFLNKFYAFEVTANGVNETPVETTITPLINTLGYRRNAIGYIKASPNGEKIAIVHNQNGNIEGGTTTNGSAYLYDFDNATGVISNAVMLKDNFTPYGIEFSAETKKLYVSAGNTNQGTLFQYDLEANDIPASEVFITSLPSGGAALQLGPNGKIYHSLISQNTLDVINAPEEDGTACNYQANGITLSPGMVAIFGLPPFITSIFSAEIEFSNTCFGDITEINIDAVGEFDSVEWDLGDGTTSSENAPEHQYNTPGEYEVIATVTRDNEVINVTSTIRIHEVPTANDGITLIECDDDNDGVTTFNLTDNNPNILGTQDNTIFEVRYYISQENAEDNSNALNATNFTNTESPQTLYARIQNRANTACYNITSFDIDISNTPELNGDSYSICDNAEDGDDTNGQATFNLNEVTEALVQDTDSYSASYYTTETNAENESAPLDTDFYNTTANEQTIYIRVVNNSNANCFVIAPVTLTVIPLPDVVNNAALIQCDLGINPDGITQFNLEEANEQFTNGNPDLVTAYYATENNAASDNNAITGAYTNTENPQTIAVRVTNTQTGCYRVLPLTLQVSVNTAPAIILENCDDDGIEDGLHNFNLEDAGIENGTDVIVYYANATDALLEQNAITTDYTNTDPYEQNVYARIESNNDCTLLQEIKLIVHELPDIETEAEAIVCNNTQEYITLTNGLSDNPNLYTYLWSTGATSRTIMVNEAGTYSVTVTNGNNCEKVRTITVTASDEAVIDDVIVTDLTDNNTVTIIATPATSVNTTYQYSIDMPNGPFQTSNFFEGVKPGIHTVYVIDKKGCGIVSKEISVLAIPKFFTPNGDGVNETWNVVGIKSSLYQKSNIYIFDRYGKFISGVKPNSIGWDGTLNGRKLPATDYWYVVELQDGRVVKGHFSMIR